MSETVSNLGRRWRAIADGLGLRIVAPVRVRLPSGVHIHADALLLDFGDRRGMLLVTDHKIVAPHSASLVDEGYGYSVLSDPGPDAKSPVLAAVKEVLRDWGWTGTPEDEPIWLRSDSPEP